MKFAEDGGSAVQMSHEVCWREWTYWDWNLKLLIHCFSKNAEAGVVERIEARPRELLLPTGAEEHELNDVMDAFIWTLRGCLPIHRVSFASFCLDGPWTPESPEPPPFFAMLWMTCLVAHGYPDESTEFHKRVKAILGKKTKLDSLPLLWHRLRAWLERSSGLFGLKQLKLPSNVGHRTDIGHSWFLTFPHYRDRNRLNELLRANDLTGDQLPLIMTVNLLTRQKKLFSRGFQEELEHFRNRMWLPLDGLEMVSQGRANCPDGPAEPQERTRRYSPPAVSG